MAPESSRKDEGTADSSSSGNDTSVIESIKALAAYNARAKLNTEEQIMLFLRSWWSQTYNRPLKDPLLASYTFEELLYEFYDRKEREEASIERLNSETDKMDDEKERAAEDWAAQEERREAEAEAAKEGKVVEDPTKDPANVAWMEDQIKKAKELYGDSFGEDINEDFSS